MAVRWGPVGGLYRRRAGKLVGCRDVEGVAEPGE